MAKKETYEAPQTQMSEVELEQGFMNASVFDPEDMNASVFDPEDQHDEGVSIKGHEFGNSGNYFDNENGASWNAWDE